MKIINKKNKGKSKFIGSLFYRWSNLNKLQPSLEFSMWHYQTWIIFGFTKLLM